MKLCTLSLFLFCSIVILAQPAPTSSVERRASIEARMHAQENSIIKELPFENIGPTICSGRVTDVEVDPKDPSHFYVAYASGGLWFTDNNGASFSPLFDHEAAMTIGDIAVDWEHEILWIGTGENNASRSSYSGVGMYKSSDLGKTWSYHGLPESQHIGRILLHPTDTNELCVAVLGALYSDGPDRGMYRTTDGGKTWEQTLFVNASAGGIDLVRSPVHPEVLYGAVWDRTRRAWDFRESGPGSGIYRSEDSGRSWQLLSRESSGFPTGATVGRIGLACGTENGKDLVYAVVDNFTPRPPEEREEGDALDKDDLRNMSKAVFLDLDVEKVKTFLEDNDFPEKYTADTIITLVRSDVIQPSALVEFLEDANATLFNSRVHGAEVYVSSDAGMHWQKTHPDFLDQVFYSYGYYFGQIRVAPRDANKIYILGVPALKSPDGGKTWESMEGDNVHGDHHALWVNPARPGHLILGNDGGINISYDDGGHWFKCNTPPVGQFYTVETDRAKPYHVYGGLQDNGVWGGPHTYEAGTSWQNTGSYPYTFLFGGDGMQVQIDFRDNQTLYTGFQFGNYARINKQTGERNFITPQHEIGERPYRWNWQSPIWLSRHQQDILYMGSQFVHRSLNQGETFEKISPDLTKGGKPGDVPCGTLTCIHESPLEFGLLYTGSDDGLVYVSRDGGHHWENIAQSLPADLWVSRVRASSHVASRVYLSLNGYRWDDFTPYLYVSEDYGKTWTPIASDLPMEAINVVAEDPSNPDLLYVGTDNGLYISFDRGGSFVSTGPSLPAVAVHDVDIQPEAHDLLVGTHGRSFYKADITQIQQLRPETLGKELVAFSIPQSGMRVGRSWGARPNAWSPYRTPEVLIPFYTKERGTVRITIQQGEIMLFETKLDVEPGLHYFPYDLSVLPGQYKAYGKILSEDGKVKELKPAENGIVYLQKGKYTVILGFGKSIERQDFELK